MSKIHELIDGFIGSFPSAAIPVPGGDLNRKHYAQFLSQGVRFWTENRDAVFRQLTPYRVELVTSAHPLGEALVQRLDELKPEFLKTAQETMAKLGGIATQANPRIPHWMGCSSRDLKLFLDEGAEKAFLPETPLWEIVGRWVDLKIEGIRSFRDEPLNKPAWQSIGNIYTPSATWVPELQLSTGLWDFDDAPWRDSCVFVCEDGPQLPPSMDGSVYEIAPGSQSVYQSILEVTWISTLSKLPLKEIGAFHELQAESPWTAGLLLDLILGPKWGSAEMEDGAFFADAQIGAWSAQSAKSFQTWYDSNPAEHDAEPSSWLIGLSARGPEPRDYGAFHLFRSKGVSISSTPAEPYALLAAYCLHQISTALDANQETPDPQQGSPTRRGPASDIKEDKRIADAWHTQRYATKAALATELQISDKDVMSALDRHRKRVTK